MASSLHNIHYATRAGGTGRQGGQFGGLVLSILVLFAAPASAQVDPNLKAPLVIYSSAMAADWGSTVYSLSSNPRAREGNPLVNWMSHEPTMLAVGAAMDVTALYVGYRLIGKSHPKLAKVLLYSLAAVRGYLVVHNIQVGRRGR
jgi:hypothetical protein